ncbi:MAG TPA: glycosyl hydrolase family 65 protein [Anaerolineaceae bacterium]
MAETLDHGSIGLFHELIPEGACFVQLWSGATYLRGVIEDLLGITVDAAEHRVRIAPQLPSGWDAAALDGLAFGDHQINMHVSRDAIAVSQHPGSAPLHVECRLPDGREWYFEA